MHVCMSHGLVLGTCSFECPCQYFHFRFAADKRLEGLRYDTEKPEDIPVILISITSERLGSGHLFCCSCISGRVD